MDVRGLHRERGGHRTVCRLQGNETSEGKVGPSALDAAISTQHGQTRTIGQPTVVPLTLLFTELAVLSLPFALSL